VNIEGDFATGTWSPVIKFGGGNTGQTVSSAAGTYRFVGNRIVCDFSIIFTAKGSSTGAATLTGLPFPIASSGVSAGGGGLCDYTANMSASLTAPPTLSAANLGTSALNIYGFAGSGFQAISDVQFTNTTAIYGTFSYQWQ
jgi:hypothetical protein